MEENLSLKERVDRLLQENPVVLFMKGEPEMPACGFSAGVVEILNQLQVDFIGVNILGNDELRSFMKEYSNWPTYPQLYYKQELLGGYDIVLEMFENGELAKLFGKK